MDKIEKQVHKARRRLNLQRFVATLGWTCTGALSVAVVLVLISRFWSLGVIPWAWPAGAVVLGIIAAWIWAVVTARGHVDAAIEIDRQFGLQERVSSSLALDEHERETEAGQALMKDAARRVERINVSERIRVSPSRRLLFPLIPAAVAVLIILFFNPVKPQNVAQAKPQAPKVQKQVKKSAKKLEKKLVEQKKKAKQQGLKDVENVLELLRKDLQKMSEAPPADRKKALAKLNNLAKQLQEQRDKAAGAEKLKDQLSHLKNLKQGPADRLARAMKQGDFDKALKELEKLREQLTSKELDGEQKQKLAEQMDNMANQMKKMADAQRQMEQKLANQIQKMRDAGQMGQANKLEEQLAKLRSQAPQMDMLDKLSKQLKQCSKCCKNGQQNNAQQAMQQMAKDLQKLQKQMNEMEMLDEAMTQMSQCRGQMCCNDGQKPGNKMCESQCAKMQGGLKAGTGHSPGGMRGDEIEAGFRDSQVRPDVGKGPMKIGGYLGGPNRKGKIGESINEQLEAAKQGETDPLTDQQVPRKYQEHVRQYSKRLLEGSK